MRLQETEIEVQGSSERSLIWKQFICLAVARRWCRYMETILQGKPSVRYFKLRGTDIKIANFGSLYRRFKSSDEGLLSISLDDSKTTLFPYFRIMFRCSSLTSFCDPVTLFLLLFSLFFVFAYEYYFTFLKIHHNRSLSFRFLFSLRNLWIAFSFGTLRYSYIFKLSHIFRKLSWPSNWNEAFNQIRSHVQLAVVTRYLETLTPV